MPWTTKQIQNTIICSFLSCVENHVNQQFHPWVYIQRKQKRWLEKIYSPQCSSVQFSSVTESYQSLCNTMNRSTADLPVHHQLPKYAQTHVHPVSDAIQPSYPPPSPSPPALIFPSIRVFSNESAVHMGWPKYWTFSFNISPSNEHPGLISFRMD